MTRTEYLQDLRRELSRLPREERESVLRYYSGVFDRAGPGKDTETINSLGTPEILAARILADWAKKTSGRNSCSGSHDGSSGCSEPKRGSSFIRTLVLILLILIGLGIAFGGQHSGGCHIEAGSGGFHVGRSGTFDDELIRGVDIQEGLFSDDIDALDISLGAGSLIIRSGKDAGWRATDFDLKKTVIEPDGGTFRFHEREWKRRFSFNRQYPMPVLEITLPEGVTLNDVRLSLGAGTVTITDLSAVRFVLENGAGSVKASKVIADTVVLESGAGSMDFSDCKVESARVETGVGRFTFNGSMGNKSSVETGVGSVEITLDGSEDLYFVEFERGLGAVNIGGKSWGGTGKGSTGDSGSPVHLKLQSGVGSIRLAFAKEK